MIISLLVVLLVLLVVLFCNKDDTNPPYFL